MKLKEENKSNMEKNIFDNSSNDYYGHGIGKNNENVVKSIFSNGLRCSHGSLYYTTIEFGMGSTTLFNEQLETLNNWKHKGSTQIVIASLPLKFQLFVNPLQYDKEAAYYTKMEDEEAKKLDLAPGKYLRPEFIKGMYDAETGIFTSNDKYYENLPVEEQNVLFGEIKKNYIDLIKEYGYSLEEYKEMVEQYGVKFPLSKDEILFDNLKKEAPSAEKKSKEEVGEDVAFKIGSVKLTPEQAENKRKWIDRFIEAYDVTETEYQKEQREEFVESDEKNVKDGIDLGMFRGNMATGIDGKWKKDSPEQEEFTIEYSEKQLAAMARLLKAAKGMTTEDGRNYLEEFSNIQDINYVLLQMRKSDGMKELFEKAAEEKKKKIPPAAKHGQELGKTQKQAEEEEKEKYSEKRREIEENIRKESEEKRVKLTNSESFKKSLEIKRGNHKTDINAFKNLLKRAGITRSEVASEARELSERAKSHSQDIESIKKDEQGGEAI